MLYHYQKPELTYAPLGVIPLVGRYELRVFVEHTPVRSRVALCPYYQCATGEWLRLEDRSRRLHVPPTSIPHLIDLLRRAIDLLPDLPPPPGAPARTPLGAAPRGDAHG
jgi:hypothetical protein